VGCGALRELSATLFVDAEHNPEETK